MAQTLALIPGLNNTHEVFSDLIPHLDASITPVTRNNDLLDSVEAIADEWLKVLPNEFWLGGFSFGGYVSLAILARAPERVKGIALICSTPYADSPEARQRRLKALDSGESQYAKMLETQIARVFSEEALKNEVLVARRQKMALDYGFARYSNHVQATAKRPESLSLLNSLAKPVLLVAAEEDVVVTAELMSNCAAKITGCEFHTIPGSGHMLPFEKPEALAAQLNAWVQSQTK